MGVLNIQKATREGAHLLIQLYGESRSGKTFSAFQIARGLVGPKGRIGVMDTESGRARLYADKVAGGFDVGELSGPYTPSRYLEGIQEFLQHGVDVLVIDSFSHVWDGPGGVLEWADEEESKSRNPNKLAKWLKPKKAYRRLVNFLLSTKMHIILCSRGKTPLIADPQRPNVMIPGHVLPIQDSKLKYEMTFVFPMLRDGTYSTDPEHFKAPGELLHLFNGQPLSVEIGAKMAEWVGGHRSVDGAGELLMFRADEAASRGMMAYQEFWASLDKAERAALLNGHENRKSAAKAADMAAEMEATEEHDDAAAVHMTREQAVRASPTEDVISEPAPSDRNWLSEAVDLIGRADKYGTRQEIEVFQRSQGTTDWRSAALAASNDGDDAAEHAVNQFDEQIEAIKAKKESKPRG